MENLNKQVEVEEPSGGHPVDVDKHEFIVPQKEVLLPEEISDWEESPAYSDLLGFISAMCMEIKGKKLRDECHVSKTVEGLLEMLDSMESWIEEFPPIDQPQRFGNAAYRNWFAKLQQTGADLVLKAIGEKYSRALPEVSVYLIEGVGNSTRIDYGTGHELAFVAFLCCLFKIGALAQEDSVAVVLKVFNKYLLLMRKLQAVYRMEPAGSQGVWNLDDYQFIPFIWGSAQLVDHPRLSPKSFPNEEICESYYKDYMFLGCIRYIHQVKTGPFHEHSNQLWNISGVKLWSKVNTGLIKMYKAEVLNKFPIIQHFLFGTLLPICNPEDDNNAEPQPSNVQSEVTDSATTDEVSDGSNKESAKTDNVSSSSSDNTKDVVTESEQSLNDEQQSGEESSKTEQPS